MEHSSEIKNPAIDGGKAFDWGKVSSDYAKYRDIYPQEFYRKILERNLCRNGQRVLDIATGTGVLPRNLYTYGARWTGIDISENQIREARRLSEENQMNISYQVCAAEELDFPADSFDVITACQCFFYLDHAKAAPKFAHMLTKGGKLLVLYMTWLPLEDPVAEASEQLVLKYNPSWSGAGETRRPADIPAAVLDDFDIVSQEQFDLKVPFTRETWHGRMKACRGVGASLDASRLAAWEQEHREALKKAPERFEVLHYASIAELQVKEKAKNKKENER